MNVWCTSLCGNFPDGRSKTTVGRCGMRHDTNIGAWERRRSSMRQWCADTFIQAGTFVLLFIYLVDQVAYVCRSYALFWWYSERSREEQRFDRLPIYCFEPPCDKFCLVCDAAG